MNYFNKSHIKNNNSFVILGMYKKSFIIKDILHNLDISYGCVISRTKNYSSWCKYEYYFSQLSQQLINDYKNIQMDYKQKSFVLIDMNNDCNILEKSYIKEFIVTHQYYNTSIIIANDNIANIIILKEENEEKRLKIYSLFIHIFKTFVKL